MKLCSAENCKEKPFSEFSIDNHSKDGYTARCKECRNASSRASYKRDLEKSRKSGRERVANWKANNPEIHRERRREYDSSYYQAHLRECKASRAKWQRDNPGKTTASANKRRAAKLQRTPIWADIEAIEEFYVNRPEGHEVDHYYPLQGDTVSGLHVLDNLGYLTVSENRSKGSKVPG